jgi:nucleoside-diphosphate-sugar epimerase
MPTNTQVIFGTGPLGLAVMDVLVAQGKTVTLVNRSGRIAEALPAGVTVVKANAVNPHEVQAVCQGAEVAYLCAMPPYTQWPALFPPLISGVLEGVAATSARLVYGDNLYMYGPNPGGPLHEDLPNAATGHKGRTRAAMAQQLLAAHAAGRIQVAIGRAPDFFGPRTLNATFGERFFGAALAHKSPDLLGKIDLPHTYTFIRDFAAALVTLGHHDAALGKVWHVPSAATVTTRQMTALFAEEIGTPIAQRVANLAILTVLGWFNPMLREIKEMYPSFANPYVVDHSRFAAAFGASPTPHAEAVRQTVAWYRQHVASHNALAVAQKI